MQSRTERSRLSRQPLWIIRFVMGLCLFLSFTAIVNLPVSAQSTIEQARVSEILDGDQVFIQDNPARVNDVANRGQRVRTGSSRAQLNFNTGAVARLSPNSVLTVGQCAQLQSGILLVNGAVNSCGNSVVAGVQGTTYLMLIDDDGQEHIKVLEGEVVVSKQTEGEIITDPTAARDGQIVLRPGQEISTAPGRDLGEVGFMSPDDFIDILTGFLFEGFLEELPGMDAIRASFEELFPGVPFPGDGPDVGDFLPRRPF